MHSGFMRSFLDFWTVVWGLLSYKKRFDILLFKLRHFFAILNLLREFDVFDDTNGSVLG
jgi:hypothetical protein